MEISAPTRVTEQLARCILPVAELTRQRTEAWNEFKKSGLPAAKSEEYKFTPITRWLEKTSAWALPAPPSANPSAMPGGAPVPGSLIVLLNGHFMPALSAVVPQAGVTVRSLRHEVPSSLGLIHSFSSDPFAALNTAAWTDGLYLHVAPQVKAAAPITLLHLQDAQAEDVQVHARVLVHVEEGAELTLIQQTQTLGTRRVFHTVVDEVQVGARGTFFYYKIQNDSGHSGSVWNSTLRQADESRVETFTLTMNGEIVRNNFRIEIAGAHCESHFHGLYLLEGNTLADNHTVVDHQKPHSFSNELYKGIIADRARGVFNGKIFVRPYAQKTNAYQSNRNILLSENAVIHTKPQLEIWADDVKCSHGCTTGQLDEQALFYLRSRGLAKDSAKALLLYAFAGETVETISHPALKQHVEKLVADRLHKNR